MRTVRNMALERIRDSCGDDVAKAGDEARGWRTLEERLGLSSPCDETFADSEPAIHVIRDRSSVRIPVRGSQLSPLRVAARQPIDRKKATTFSISRRAATGSTASSDNQPW